MNGRPSWRKFSRLGKGSETDAALYRKINAHNNVALELVEASNETESYA